MNIQGGDMLLVRSTESHKDLYPLESSDGYKYYALHEGFIISDFLTTYSVATISIEVMALLGIKYVGEVEDWIHYGVKWRYLCQQS